MLGAGHWPVWLLVIACGTIVQLVKLVCYSVVERRLDLRVLVRSTGLPSLHAATLSCLTTALALHDGWRAATTAVALAMTVIIVHDAIRVRGVRDEQRTTVHALVSAMTELDTQRRRVLDYLEGRAHRPSQVGAGVAFGVLFALALARSSS